MKAILYVGIDVDDKSFHICGFNPRNKDLFELRCKPDTKSLLSKLKLLESNEFNLRTCYEATYIGYSLHRFLISKGIDNQIVASSLIPHCPGVKLKTDRLDSRKLAIYSARELLTPIYIPENEDEQIRDLIRSRGFLVNKRSSLKKHVLSTCRRYSLNYKGERKGKQYWTKPHMDWLIQKMKGLDRVISKNLELQLSQYSYLTETIERYNEEIKGFSVLQRYKGKSEALCCFRGISTLSAMILITEIGDIRRFSHPHCLTSYVGLGIKEYSSGGKDRKFGISKMGNRYVRTILVEACQSPIKCYSLSRRLKESRKDQSQEFIEISDRCMRRLRKKSILLEKSNKHINVIKIACAREFLCFIWEMLMQVEKSYKDEMRLN